MTPLSTTYALWVVWLVSWRVAAFWSARTEKRASLGPELWFRLILGAGVILLFAVQPGSHYFAQKQLWHSGDVFSWIMAALVLAAFSFAWWARIHLGRLWSDWGVTKKPNHYVVETGPYRLVRHPIYSGLIVAAFATGIEKGTSFALIGAALMTLAFYTKAHREEHFLRAELGEDAYAAYARRTAMLFPLMRT